MANDDGMLPTNAYCNGLRPKLPAQRRCQPCRRMDMQIAIYARVSTARQQQMQTIEQQIERLRAHSATQSGWQLKDEHIYRDDG